MKDVGAWMTDEAHVRQVHERANAWATVVATELAAVTSITAEQLDGLKEHVARAFALGYAACAETMARRGRR